MTYYIRQKVTLFRDKFAIYDVAEIPCYYAEGKVLSWARTLSLTDPNGQEVARLRKKVWSWLPRYIITQNETPVAELVRRFSLRPRFTVSGPDWTVTGNFWAHDFTLTDREGRQVATVHKAWVSWADCYAIEIANGVEDAVVLATVLGIDCIRADTAAATS